MAYFVTFPSEEENGCPIIDKPGINISAMIQAIIVGVILWYLLTKR